MSRDLQAKKVTDALKTLVNTKAHHSLGELRLVVALERAIARLERHPKLQEHLIFKGGFVLLKVLDTARFTRDVDALAIGVSRERIAEMVDYALKLDLNDGFWFGDTKIKDLKDQGPYGGYRFDCAFQIGNPPKEEDKIKKLSRIHIDIGFGDAIQELPKKQSMKSVLTENKPVSWYIYPMEYIFAEKLEALFSRGSASSRAKDIYDMPLVFPLCEINTLLAAINKTFQIRETPVPSAFFDVAKNFDVTLMKNSWGSVDIADESATFESSWDAFLSCLKKIDQK